MSHLKSSVCLLILSLSVGHAQTKAANAVQFEMMTWPEVKHALESGKTTALVYNGGTEQRGPQNVNGGHTLIAHAVAVRIAEKLGNAIVAPVMPFSVNNASATLPGTIGLTSEVFTAVNERVAEQLIKTGFKNIVLMGDHGGGQKELAELATKMDAEYSPKGVRVIFCDQVYAGTKEHPGAQPDFEKWLADNGYPSGGHAGVSDTSEMLYLGGNEGWVRKDLVPTALGDPVAARGQRPEHKVDNGITGDARRSTAELGKRFIDMKVDYSVREIRALLSESK
jgi:creatinine amidohydrolase/Fe(II)-dependent formamide hydrolase-like protein